MIWNVLATTEFEEWIGSTSPAIQAEVEAKVELLKTLGPALRRPHADTLAGSRHSNMKELRVRTSGSEVRIAFAFDPTRSAILLCAGDKIGVGKRNFYKKLIEKADRLFDAHLAGLRKEGGSKRG